MFYGLWGTRKRGIVSASLLERGYGWRLCCQFLSHTITSYIFVTNISVEIALSLRCSWFDHSWIPQLGTNISIFIVVETIITCNNTIQSGASPTGGGRPPPTWKPRGTILQKFGYFSNFLDTFNFFPQFSNISEMKWFRSEEKLNFGIRRVWVLMNSTSLSIQFVATPLNTIQ